MKRFNLLFPLIFLTCETVIISLISSLMHSLTFSDWNVYNTLIVIFWVFLNVYTKSYNIGRGVSYLNTVKTALKSIFLLFSLLAIANLFINYYPFSIKSIFFALSIFTFSIIFFRILTHFILERYRSYGGNIKHIANIHNRIKQHGTRTNDGKNNKETSFENGAPTNTHPSWTRNKFNFLDFCWVYFLFKSVFMKTQKT